MGPFAVHRDLAVLLLFRGTRLALPALGSGRRFGSFKGVTLADPGPFAIDLSFHRAVIRLVGHNSQQCHVEHLFKGFVSFRDLNSSRVTKLNSVQPGPTTDFVPKK